jgi:N-methylhydantoinase B
VISISCSGGGYGPATERDPERVRADVAEGWVSRERARITYGVVLRDDGSIDEVKTETARTSLAAPPDEP